MDGIALLFTSIAFAVGAVAGIVTAFRYHKVRAWFSERARRVDVGSYTFELRYLYALRNPSGRIVLMWTDELDGTHIHKDPQVLVKETTGSELSRVF
jgi:hypothetical protein